VETREELRTNTDSVTNTAPIEGDVEWALIPGDVSTKPELATTYGGNRQAGISVSGRTPNILCYTNAQKNERHGYNFDGWVDGDSLFHYTGHGDEGDQVFRVGRKGIGNAALRDHVVNSKTVRMFVADGTMPGTSTGRQLYIGEFHLDASNPYFRAESLDVLDELRSVIVFRLLAVGNVLVRPEDRCPNEIQPSGIEPILEVSPEPETDTTTSVEDVEFADSQTTTFERRPMESMTGQLREKQLVWRYREFLTAQGHEYTLQRYQIPGSSAYNEIDLLDTTRNELVEAKSSSTRGHVRYAIGQLMDYERRIHPTTTAMLLPSCPSDDLLDLIHQAGVVCIFEEAAGVFTRIEPPI
jgi:5-methylcytosine-specific restriction protein A